LRPLVARCEADPRILGAALLLPEHDDWTRVLIATTWDGLEPVADLLPEMAAEILGNGPAEVRSDHDGTRWRGLTSEDERLDLELVRMSELVPDPRADPARPIHDPAGLLEQWTRWCRGKEPEPIDEEAEVERARTRRLFHLDDGLRSLEQVRRGTRRVQARGRTHPLRHEIGSRLRSVADRIEDEGPVAASLADRVRRATRDVPLAGEGVLVDAFADDEEALERFYGLADDEGFAGDRPLFEAARARLSELGAREPRFEQGFVLPTFDAVEARFGLDEATGGCQPPLVPGVLVGVGVTPKDALEVWAAPCVREPTCATACVADAGERTVCDRGDGLEAVREALLDAVEHAFDRVAGLLGRAREAGEETVGDVQAALRGLHLPRSHAAAVRAGRGIPLSITRLALALAVARVGEDGPPLVARKLGLAAGRLLA
jgi:hypothetical protein